MKNLTLITALLLYSLSWVSVSGSQFQTVEVQSGEAVTLTCSNTSKYDGITFWFRLLKSKINCISVMANSNSKGEFCDGHGNGKFSMWSNITTISLKIQTVELNDSGQYFCGFYVEGRPSFNLIHLKIKGSDGLQDGTDNTCKNGCDGITKTANMILGAVTVFLIMVIVGLVVKNKKLQTADREQNPGRSENNASADLNYAAVAFRPKGRRREPEPNVIYAATR